MGKNLNIMTTKVKNSKKVTVKENGLKAQAQVFNKTALQVTEDMIDLALKNGAAGQKIFGKVLAGGVTIFGMQQELVLNTLEKVAQDERVQKWVKVPAGYFNRFRKTAEETTVTVKETVEQVTAIAKVEGAKVANKINKQIEVLTKAKNEVVETVEETTTELVEKAVEVKEEIVETVTEKGAEMRKIVEDTVEELEGEDTVEVAVDDLKKINGIGPKVAEILAAGGYGTFQQVAQANVEDLKQVLETAGTRYKKFDPAPWVEQAKLAAVGNWEGLKNWTAA